VYDPEGILSTVPAIATTLLGMLAGIWMRRVARPPRIVRGFLLWGVIAAAVGLFWGRWFPINKSLWTSSYVVFTAGAALLVLAACYWLIEVRDIRWWTPPFAALGVNALAVFFLSTLLAITLARIHVAVADGRLRTLQPVLFETLFLPWAPAVLASLAWALSNVLLWLLVVWALARRGIRLSV
jgi:predicted acyltransferase